MRKSIFSLLLVGAVAGIARAEDATGRLGIGGWGGWTDAVATDSLNEWNDSSEGWGVAIRKGLSPKNEISISYDQLSLDTKGTTENVLFQPIMLNWIHSFAVDSKLTPFFSIGAGPTTTKFLDSDNDHTRRTVFGAKAGVGLEYFVTKRFSVGAVGNYHYAAKSERDLTNEASVLSAGLMANFFFLKSNGEPKAEESAVPSAQAVTAAVEPAATAAPAVVAGAAAAVAVADAEKDTDNDGVIDSLDKCAETPAGVLVDTTGCPAEKVSVTLDIKFDTGKTVVDSKYDPRLAKAAAYLKSHPTVTVEIEGHSDNVGDKAQNKTLSLKRAEAVRQALITRHGADAAQMKAVGYGDERPIADNTTAEGREINRRVMATMTAKPQ
ncbi:MAG: OmpA family protein [Elusimicrobia bacterium]|nr:OmpA family protein [Elusimicrobiota bacterium]